VADAEERIAIGQIVRPFGVRGEVRVRSLSDVPGRFEGLREVTLVSPSGQELATVVRCVRGGGDSYVVGFEAFSSPEDAASFRGGLILIPGGRSPVLPSGQYYECDLIGMTVAAEDGRVLGTLEQVVEAGGNHLFVVHGDGRDVLVPATKSVVASVDVADRRMTVRTVEGLFCDELDGGHAL
jgi:16S rRNA processing protein RimM